MDAPDRPGVSFLFIDLDMANTFLDIAETIKQEEIRKRNIANAEKAFDAITRFAPRANLTESERAAITEGLCAVRIRLDTTERDDAV